MNEVAIISEEDIKKKIYVIRGKEVMLDSDLAKFYKCTNGTKDINKAVKRNKDRFPEDFYFQLTKEEYKILRFQIETSNNDKEFLKFQNGTSSFNNHEEILRFQNGTSKKSRGGRQYIPFAFTEQGVAMLSSVLKTEVAAKLSVNIMRAFVAMRHILIDNIDYQKELFIMQNRISNIDNKLIEYDSKFDILFDNFTKKSSHIFYERQTYDAYSYILDIFNKAKKELIIIDNYIDKKILDLICNLKVNVIIISKNMNEELIKKYKSQYNNLTVIHNESFHDRFIIVDRKTLYHSGASFKDIGKYCSNINKVEEKIILDGLLNYLNLD